MKTRLSPRYLATLRKRAQRARQRSLGRRKVEVWVSGTKSQLLGEFGARTGLTLLGVVERLVEHVGPLYVREVDRRLGTALPATKKLRIYEHYGFGRQFIPAGASAPVRVGVGARAVVLDPAEYVRLRGEVDAAVRELANFGITEDMLRALAMG